ncbi:MAG: YciI-like protein [Gammaproteobacteria bacterium]
MHFLLIYELAPDYLERRGEFRKEHLELGWQAHERGELVVAGAMSDPADMAALFFNCASAEVVEQFAKGDPYVIHGLVTKYHVRQWNTAIGETAFTPIRL